MASEGLMAIRGLMCSVSRRQLATVAAINARCLSSSSRVAARDVLNEIEPDSSFSAPILEKADIEAFNTETRVKNREAQLPGKRFQYHPPKYDRGPLHPVQSPKHSDPVARDFIPGPFNHPRLRETFQHTISSDILTLTYQHTIPGTPAKPERERLRAWDDSSPYHANRPLRGPRGAGTLPILEKDIKFHNIPEIRSVHIHCFQPQAGMDPGYLAVSRAIVMAISGRMPKVTWIKNQVSQWKIKKGSLSGCKTTIFGNQAYEFVDKLATLVFPKIKDWPGIKGEGDGSGTITFGLNPTDMAHFPEVGVNYDMFPSKMIPGLHVMIRTTATSDRQARLLMQTLGVPMTGKF
ncbi:50S ribosomal protein L5 [Ceratocystis fimbriata CBS 114723]|uniref:50S ribosomal protein L5 n=1 Tax=Ceratocystis fimbriata CBS 114723 TaxID=1035309 RepID=A0A2C5WY59_9PEZI|nr:50S ribosomal protein L5 [Ceratocystis fimbriata CBS 114723]